MHQEASPSDTVARCVATCPPLVEERGPADLKKGQLILLRKAIVKPGFQTIEKQQTLQYRQDGDGWCYRPQLCSTVLQSVNEINTLTKTGRH